MKTTTNKGVRPPVIPFTDDEGRDCIRVPLDPYGNAYAVVLERDYREVKNAGATGVWRLNANDKGQHYVRTAVPNGKGDATNVSVARIIVGAGARSTIYYVNKDRLDLRPENLWWHRNGKAKRCDAEIAERGAKYRQERQRQRQQQEEAQRVAA